MQYWSLSKSVCVSACLSFLQLSSTSRHHVLKYIYTTHKNTKKSPQFVKLKAKREGKERLIITMHLLWINLFFLKHILFYCRYFKQVENEETEGKEDNFYWWHKMLANYFESTDNLDRYVEVCQKSQQYESINLYISLGQVEYISGLHKMYICYNLSVFRSTCTS